MESEKVLHDRKERLTHVYDELKYQKRIATQGDFAEAIGKHRMSVSSALKGDGKYLTERFLESVSRAYPQYTFSWLMDGDDQPRTNLKEKKLMKQTSIPYLDVASQKEYHSNYYSDEYLRLMPKIMTDVDLDGRQVAFEVGENGLAQYQVGDTVICREIDRSKWKGDLEIETYDFVIAHTVDKILMREVLTHDVEEGLLTCSSGTGESVISLREVAHLYHIVEHRVSAENIKKRRS